MIHIGTINAAKANDLAATAAIVEALEGRVQNLARQFSGTNNNREELAQVARAAAWEAIGRHEGDDVDAFFAYLYVTAEGTLRDYTRAARSWSADDDAMKVFAQEVENAGGDVYEAERRAQTEPPAGRRLSKARAYAARIAWQGGVSLDAPHGENGATLADTLAAEPEPERDAQLRPKVGHGAALEALSVLERYAGVVVQRMTSREFAANLPALVDVLEDTVSVPRDPAERRYVLDAMAILRSAVSTSTDGELAEDLRDAADDQRDARAETVANVRAVLDMMGAKQRKALELTFGINGASEFGCRRGSDLDGFAAAMGTSVSAAKAARSNAFDRFTVLWIARMARTEAEAVALAAAALAEKEKRAGNSYA